MSSNSLIAAASLAAIAFIWVGALNTPVTSIIAGYLTFQWLQVTSKVWIASIYSIDLGQPQTVSFCDTCVFRVFPTTENAIYLALSCLAATSLAARMFSRPTQVNIGKSELNPLLAVFAYLILLVLSRVGSGAGGLAQPLLALGALRLSVVLVVCYAAVAYGRLTWTLVILVVFETALGFTGYFAGFAMVFFVLGVGLIAVAKTHWPRVRLGLMIAVPILIILGTVWQVVKPSYRAFMNAGTQTQTIQVGFGEQIGALAELSGALDAKDLTRGFISVALRLEYVDFLSNAMEQVPSVIPHQAGGLWSEAIYHVLTPRILFPDKPALPSDSERTIAFTGRIVASGDKGTSISIGYVGDSYIDFGTFGAVAISFGLGWLYAVLASSLFRLSPMKDPGVILAIVVVFLSMSRTFEISSIKLFPGILWSYLVALLVVRLIPPSFAGR
jgi:hypothetical protein